MSRLNRSATMGILFGDVMDLQGRKIVITGGAGFLGRAVQQTLKDRGVGEIVIPRQKDYDLVPRVD